MPVNHEELVFRPLCPAYQGSRAHFVDQIAVERGDGDPETSRNRVPSLVYFLLASRQSSVGVFLQLTCGVQANVKIVRSGEIFMHNRFNSHTIVHPEHAATAGAHCFACLAVALCQASSELCTTPKPAVHATKMSSDTRITLHTSSRGVTQYAPVSPGTLSIFVPAKALSKRRHGRASAIPERLCTSRRLVN